MTGFPDKGGVAARADMGVLFRVEQPIEGMATLLVQSQIRPSWVFETDAVREVRTGSLDTLETRIVDGAMFRFRLRANPTRRVHERATRGPDLREMDSKGAWRDVEEIPPEQRTGLRRRIAADTGRPGQRVELRREEDRIAWLERRGREQDGFEIVSVRLDVGLDSHERDALAVRADPAGRIHGLAGKTDQRLTFATALFDGQLRVTNREAFANAWRSGIGPGKAFGCGLISILPMT